MKKALITGITGQDGSYLSEGLLVKGYAVHDIARRASLLNTQRIDHPYQGPHDPATRLFLNYGDLTDGSRLVTLLEKVRPERVSNLAAQPHVRVSFDEPEFTGLNTRVGTMRLLEASLMIGLQGRYDRANSPEMYEATLPPQNENTPFWPRLPCGVAKVFAYPIAAQLVDADCQEATSRERLASPASSRRPVVLGEAEESQKLKVWG